MNPTLVFLGERTRPRFGMQMRLAQSMSATTSNASVLTYKLLVPEMATRGRNHVARGRGHYCSSTSDRRLL
jgi:hypothetical protein